MGMFIFKGTQTQSLAQVDGDVSAGNGSISKCPLDKPTKDAKADTIHADIVKATTKMKVRKNPADVAMGVNQGNGNTGESNSAARAEMGRAGTEAQQGKLEGSKYDSLLGKQGLVDGGVPDDKKQRNVLRTVVHCTAELSKWYAGNRRELNRDIKAKQPVGTVRVGIIVRDWTGSVLGSSAQTISAGFSPLVAEAIALLRGLCFARDVGLWPCLVELDALSVVNLILDNGPLPCSEIGFVIQDIKNIIAGCPDCKVAFAPRLANLAAHSLAKFGLTIERDGFWLEDCPPEIFSAVLGDCPSLMHNGTTPIPPYHDPVSSPAYVPVVIQSNLYYTAENLFIIFFVIWFLGNCLFGELTCKDQVFACKVQRAVRSLLSNGNALKTVVLERFRVANPMMLRPVVFSRFQSASSAHMEEHGFESTRIADE
ncbi:hypothetical protein EZV62_026096 [Acer yangbiense]|uniref:RNase H type-1 domain-containing protein n=1 Tax=Acer yangbiense TaxID=1000413 RepID=A0A5C7GR57_9ROSI|nr:hypothetical protein EZV62_026096 [Acer yangbiense]